MRVIIQDIGTKKAFIYIVNNSKQKRITLLFEKTNDTGLTYNFWSKTSHINVSTNFTLDPYTVLVTHLNDPGY